MVVLSFFDALITSVSSKPKKYAGISVSWCEDVFGEVSLTNLASRINVSINKFLVEIPDRVFISLEDLRSEGKRDTLVHSFLNNRPYLEYIDHGWLSGFGA